MEISDGTKLVWNIASIEAQNLKHKEILPSDIILGLLKVVDIEEASLLTILGGTEENGGEIVKEIAELRTAFTAARIERSTTRKKIRRETFHRLDDIEYKDHIIHRSTLTKKLFEDAKCNNKVTAISLLNSLINGEVAELERTLLLVGFPLLLLKRELSKRFTPKNESNNNLKSIEDWELVSEDLLKHCRTAIGYIELEMFSEAEVEINKVGKENMSHPLVKKIKEDITNKRG
jgi:hypothetical protein